MKRLTIITINYNNALGLHKTLGSIVTQKNKNFEYVVVDGASEDESITLIQKYNLQDFFDTQIVSEPDLGIYNAMNKGIKMAKGEYLLFLNSGDTLENTDVVQRFMEANVTADVATGIERKGDLLIYPPAAVDLTYSYFYENTLLHQSTFIRRDAFQRFGTYREDYQIVSDWEWFFRTIIRDGATYQTLDFIVADFDCNGISHSSEFRTLQNLERERVHQEILPCIRKDYEELDRLRKISIEYDHLKNGRLGFIVNWCLKIKTLKRK